MIVRDEEPRIESCLRSIAPYVDEMVVVDTGSTDRTREIARECGARVFLFPWMESFAEARNQSIEQARGEWIFWMDADDLISPECGAGLRRLVRERPGRDAAFLVQVRIPPGPGEYSPSVVDHVKLFPNRPDLRFEHRIHEQVLPAIRRAGLEVLPSELFVTHENYDRSEEGQARKRVRDFRLLELDLKDHPDHPFVLYNLGMTYLYATREYEAAAHSLRRSLDRSHPRDSIVRKAYAMLVTARICAGEWEAALQANEEGRGYYPEDAELLFQAGQLYQRFGAFEPARAALERLVRGEEDPHYRSVDVGLRTYRGRHELALLYCRMGDVGRGERLLREIAAAHPAYLPARADLAETLAAQGKRGEAEALLREMPEEAGTPVGLEALRERLGIG
jgi:glycosyltransferase involved in cell wall biosynthesis